eukprot:COSAG02_NODE_488_length_21256_cov_9.406579_15_plen_107_part_00
MSHLQEVRLHGNVRTSVLDEYCTHGGVPYTFQHVDYSTPYIQYMYSSTMNRSRVYNTDGDHAGAARASVCMRCAYVPARRSTYARAYGRLEPTPYSCTKLDTRPFV